MISEYKIVWMPYPYDGTQPKEPPPGVMWVLRRDNVAEMVEFICPCGCGRPCPTPVCEGQKQDHEWLFSVGPNGGPTLSPSIRWLSGCMAHFNIDDGKVTLHAS